MSIFTQRKMALAHTRKSITYDEWYTYLENNYPKWWKSVFGDKWRINIIYYGRNNNQSDVYPMYINKYSTMYEIMKIFYSQLLLQKSTLNFCFGMDISENIIKYLPENDFNPNTNYIYIHKHKANIDGSCNFKRYNVNNNTSLLHLSGKLCDQDSSIINLRIRKNPMNLDSSDFSKIFRYW